MRSLLSILLLCLASIVSCLSYSGNRLLVVLEDAAEKSKYGKFLGDLEARGFSLDVKSPKDDKLSLFQLGARAYDHVLLLPPKSKAYGPTLTPNLLLDFAKAEGNILLALSSQSTIPSGIVSLLLELDIQIPAEKGSVVIDHFNALEGSGEEHDVLLVPVTKPKRSDAKDFFSTSKNVVVPHAVGQVLGASTPLLQPILKAPSTGYVANPKEESIEDLFASGNQVSLVSAHQARNSARITVIGSAEMLQDAYFTTEHGNEEFARKVLEWTFKETGVLKVGLLQHWLNDGQKAGTNASQALEINPSIYRIKNDVTYQIELSEYSRDTLRPFVPPAGDEIQLEFSMLSPFHRLPLKAVQTTKDSTIYSASFTTPDQHGIFNFRVNYKRPFFTVVDEKRQVTVRHFAHDEWPRSWAISGAWVWIAGIWITVAGWVGFVAVWLYSAPPRTVVKKAQ